MRQYEAMTALLNLTRLEPLATLRKWLCALILLFSLASPAIAEKRALLIAAGSYDNPAIEDLKATPNDLMLMVNLSKQLAIPESKVIILADEHSDRRVNSRRSGRATRANIRAAMESLAGVSRAGDDVLIYFTGHGSQQPDQKPGDPRSDEADGWDELILPVDAGVWSSETGSIINAITDDELGVMLDSIRSKGANVWLVMDSCNSGTLLRGVSAGNRQAKAISPETLGIPSTIKIPSAPSYGLPMEEVGGAITAFYAAPANQAALADIWWDAAGEPSGEPYSLLTFALDAAMRKGGVTSYRELARLTSLFYGMQRKPAALMPQFSGNMEKGVLGSPIIQRRQWPITISGNAILLEAGSLDLLKEGDLINVIGSADDGPPRKFQISGTTLSRSFLEPVEPVPFNLDKRSGLTGELIGSPTGLAVRVFIEQGENEPLREKIRERLDPRASQERSHLRFVDKKHLSDLTIVPVRGEVRIFRTNYGPDTPGDGVVSIRCLADMCLEDIVPVVARQSHAIQLIRILSLNTSTLDVSDLMVRGTIQTLDQSDEQTCGKWRADVERHIFLDTTSSQAVPEILAVSNCDQLEINISMSRKAPSDMAADITALYIGADGTIANMLAPGQNIRLQAGDQLTARQRSIRVGQRGITYPFGSENIMLIAAIRSTSDPVQDYAWLARSTNAETFRSADGQDASETLERLLSEITGPGLRGVARLEAGSTQLISLPLLFGPRE